MFYNRIEIHKCKRFGLNKLDTITITPKSKTILVLGRNGCGKSSFTDIGLSVLPIDKRHFNKGGYREQDITYNGNVYFLRSAHDGEHIYKKNGETIYEGKVASVYRELVQEEFGVNQRIHDLLLGKRRFTDMSPSTERREWITRLSKSDFEYALGFYDRLRKEGRATLNVIKHLKGRLATETAKVMNEDEIQGFRSRHDATMLRINELFTNIDSKYSHINFNKQSIPNIIQEIISENNWIKGNLGYIPLPMVKGFKPITNFEDLRTVITSLQVNCNNTMETIQQLSTEQGELESKLRNNEHEDVDPVKLNEDIDSTELAIDKLMNDSQYVSLFSDMGYNIPHSRNTLVSAIDFLDNYRQLNLIVDVSEKQTRDGQVDQLRSELSMVEGELSKADAIIDHYESCKATECPNCKHEFVVGGNKSAYDIAKDKYSGLIEKHKQISNALDDQREWYNGYKETVRQLNELSRFQQTHGDLSPMWYEISNWGLTDKNKTLHFVDAYIQHLKRAASYSELTSKLKVLEATMQSISNGNDTNIYREQLNILNERLEALTAKYSEEQDTLREVERAMRIREQISRKTEYVMELYKKLQDLIETDIGKVVNNKLEEMLRAEQLELHNLKATISAAEVQQGIVNDIQSQLDELSIKDLHYKVLEQELSPNNGYIAKLISEEIGSLLDVQNQLIKSIWKYPLTILNCTTENGDLNYRFPMLVGQHGNIVADIGDGSTSICDIVNFSFRLLVHKALEISNYPLVVDELERALDGPHRESLHHVIQSLTTDSTWGQVFVVSHYIEGMLSYPNAEFVVLDDTGLNLPFEYNQNVVIK